MKEKRGTVADITIFLVVHLVNVYDETETTYLVLDHKAATVFIGRFN